MHSFTKQPNEIIPISMDFQYLLNSTEVIVSVVAIAADSAGTNKTSTIIHNYTIVGDVVKVVAKNGDNGVKYKITIRATTDEHNVYEEDIFMKVHEI